MKYTIQIPLIISVYFSITIFYTFYENSSIWMDILWAVYKNATLVACFYLMFQGKKIIWTDKLFLGIAIINVSIQSIMLTICPFSDYETKKLHFDRFAWFTILCAITSISIYLNELFSGTNN